MKDHGACPTCGEGGFGVSVSSGEAVQARPGDLGVCTGCGEFLRFNAARDVEKLPNEAMELLPEGKREQMWAMRHVALLLLQVAESAKKMDGIAREMGFSSGEEVLKAILARERESGRGRG